MFSELTGDDTAGVCPADAMMGVSAGDTPWGVLYGELHGDTAGLMLCWCGSIAKPCACGCFVGTLGLLVADGTSGAAAAAPDVAGWPSVWPPAEVGPG